MWEVPEAAGGRGLKGAASKEGSLAVQGLWSGRVPGRGGVAHRAPAGGRGFGGSGGTRAAYMPGTVPLVSMSVRLPRRSCSSSKALNSELKLPAPKPWSGRKEVSCGPRKPTAGDRRSLVVPGGCSAE